MLSSYKYKVYVGITLIWKLLMTAESACRVEWKIDMNMWT
jgi:hypothetical protein